MQDYTQSCTPFAHRATWQIVVLCSVLEALAHKRNEEPLLVYKGCHIYVPLLLLAEVAEAEGGGLALCRAVVG